MKAVITGGSDGIGLAIASVFAAEGAELWLVARSAEKLKAVAESLRDTGVSVNYAASDLTNPTAANDVSREISVTWNHLDVLVNNAGMAPLTGARSVIAKCRSSTSGKRCTTSTSRILRRRKSKTTLSLTVGRSSTS